MIRLLEEVWKLVNRNPLMENIETNVWQNFKKPNRSWHSLLLHDLLLTSLPVLFTFKSPFNRFWFPFKLSEDETRISGLDSFGRKVNWIQFSVGESNGKRPDYGWAERWDRRVKGTEHSTTDPTIERLWKK